MCQDAVESEDSVSGEGWEQDSPRELPRGLSCPWTLHSPSFPLLSSDFGVFFPLLLLELPHFPLCTLEHKKLFFVINSY